MASPSNPHLRKEPQPITRRNLARVLGLSEASPPAGLALAGAQLLRTLQLRRQAQSDRGAGDLLDSSKGAGSNDLDQEIVDLEAALARWASPNAPNQLPIQAREKPAQFASRVDRNSLAGALLGAAAMFILLVAYAGGYRIVRLEGGGFAASMEKPAHLILVGRLSGSTLRILDADRDELLIKTEAKGASVELQAGRYALEVSREDCPDTWTRSLYFEPGSTHSFEPVLCVGEGRLTIRTNVPSDRMQIDGFDVGVNGGAPHTLPVGDHTIRIEKRGYTPYEARIRMKPDEQLELRAELALKTRSGSKASEPKASGVEVPKFKQATPARPEPFDLGDLKQAVTPPSLAAQPSRLLLRNGREDLSAGGSTAWHDRVSRELIVRFDADESGQIDRIEESDTISCAFWKDVEADFNRGGLGLSMAHAYGFDGSEWQPKALGFAKELRGAAYAKMRECGLAK